MIQPHDGVAPLIAGIESAKKSIDILIFRMDWKELEAALKEASGKGVAVRALIAYTNTGGEARLRSLETRFLAAGITVGRTAGDLIRYHGKMMLVDRKTLFLLSFNFVHIDIEHSRGFGIVSSSPSVVKGAVTLFEADLNRTPYTAGLNGLVVSPVNARKRLSAFLKLARKQLLIYDPKIADPAMLGLLENRARAGVDIRIIGSTSTKSANLRVAPLTSMRLHTRTIIRDGSQAFIGSQSLRQPELDLRREIGIMVRDPKVVRALIATFETDWASTGFDEESHASEDPAGAQTKMTARAAGVLLKGMSPLRTTIKKAVKQAINQAGAEVLADGEIESAVKSMAKKAVKDAVGELVQEQH